MDNLKASIELQREKAPSLKSLNFYKIKNPIFGSTHIHIFCNNLKEEETKIVADHFYDLQYLEMLNRGEYDFIKNKLIHVIFAWLGVLIFFVLVLIITFKYLERKELSFIPLVSLIVLTIALLFLILNLLRLKVINKVIDNKYCIDSKLLKLYIYRFSKLEKYEEEDSGVKYECGKLADECNKN